MKTVFKEEQKFTQWWLWLILLATIGVPIFYISKRLFFEGEIHEESISITGSIIFLLCIFGFLALFWMMRLKTEIDEEGIKMNFVPFAKKQVKWNEIKSAKIINYGFVGYGIRFGSEYGTIYNTKGTLGLSIEKKTGEKFVIGTLKADEMMLTVEKYLQN